MRHQKTMSLPARRELTAALQARYQMTGNSRTQKGRILDEFVAATGYSRKYAITQLNRNPWQSLQSRQPSAEQQRQQKPPRQQQPPGRRCRRRRYGSDVERALLLLWKASHFLCSKRLAPFLPELAAALERHGRIELHPNTKEKLASISPATCDRLLAPHRKRCLDPAEVLFGLSTTKPGTLLRSQIPIRTFSDWKESERRPGFVEADLVAHCAESNRGEYLFSLCLTDVFTGWTECAAVAGKGQKAVCAAIERVRQRLPFALKGIDSDNGCEFINEQLLNYCTEKKITFTRCRPYQKNDQCRVEQKNWSVIRQWIGYERYEGEAAQAAMEALYERLRLFVNFFQPSLKLKSKERTGGGECGASGAKVKKQYEKAQTPYQRLLTYDAGRALYGLGDEWRQTHGEALKRLYPELDPLALLWQLKDLREALSALLGHRQEKGLGTKNS